MLIAHITDIHITETGKKAYDIADTGAKLALCVDHINRLKPQPDLVLITGDITYSGLPEEARHAASLLNGLNYPFYIIPGNHDDRTTLRSAFSRDQRPSSDQNFIQYVIKGYPIRMIGVDSVDAAPGGRICPARATWLAERLAEEKEQPTIIFMHHPPVKCGVLETDEDGFVGADRLGDIIEKYSNIQRILCGHIHLETHVRWRGTVVSTAPSTGLRLGLDLTLKKPSEFYLDAPGYQLHFWHPEQHLVSHTMYVRDMCGPYLFEE